LNCSRVSPGHRVGSRPGYQERDYEPGAELRSDDGTSGGLRKVMRSDVSSGVAVGTLPQRAGVPDACGQLRAARHDLRATEIIAWSELRGSSRTGTWPWNCSPMEP